MNRFKERARINIESIQSKDKSMLTNYLFKDLYEERWGNSANPDDYDASSPAAREGEGAHGILDRLAALFRRRRNRASAWSFTIPSEMPDTESDIDVERRAESLEPKFLILAKALSRNC
ncbi:hypothetical protein [Rhizobium sp. BR 362]|uniref:hypothetical protein n=1 Tax=Rhizobium sp. BR 362 TaxID=3040670 RepID=UPI002F407094